MNKLVITIDFDGFKTVSFCCKTANIPAIKQDDKWLPVITALEIFDDGPEGEEWKVLWQILANVYELAKTNAHTDIDKLGTIHFSEYKDEMLQHVQTLSKVFPSCVSFIELDHSSTSPMIAEITWVFNEVQ